MQSHNHGYRGAWENDRDARTKAGWIIQAQKSNRPRLYRHTLIRRRSCWSGRSLIDKNHPPAQPGSPKSKTDMVWAGTRGEIRMASERPMKSRPESQTLSDKSPIRVQVYNSTTPRVDPWKRFFHNQTATVIESIHLEVRSTLTTLSVWGN